PALLMFVNWPYTLICVKPTNDALHRLASSTAGPEARRLVARWGWLHAVRSALGVAALGGCFGAARRGGRRGSVEWEGPGEEGIGARFDPTQGRPRCDRDGLARSDRGPAADEPQGDARSRLPQRAPLPGAL